MALNPYDATPIFTPAMADAPCPEQFVAKPLWADTALLVGADQTGDDHLLFRDSVCFFKIAPHNDLWFRINALSFVIICELTRFRLRGGVVINDTSPHSYPKITTGHGNITIARLVVGASHGVKVQSHGADSPSISTLLMAFADLEVESLSLKDAKGPRIDARIRAIAYAEKMTRSYAKRMSKRGGPKGFDIPAYIANLHNLFSKLDER